VRRPGAGPDRGSVSLFVVACVGLLLLVGAALGVVAALVRAHRQAQAAADLAALAVASAASRGADPCAAGAAIAEANGGRLASCVVAGRTGTVRVVVTGPRWLGQLADLEAGARAGPA
jgi:secretion/DNA translocation related TadE-like protein